jgi:hypothetical protein
VNRSHKDAKTRSRENDLTYSGRFQGNPELPDYGGQKGVAGAWWCAGSVMERRSRGSIPFRACSVSSQSIWIECDWMVLNLN